MKGLHISSWWSLLIMNTTNESSIRHGSSQVHCCCLDVQVATREKEVQARCDDVDALRAELSAKSDDLTQLHASLAAAQTEEAAQADNVAALKAALADASAAALQRDDKLAGLQQQLATATDDVCWKLPLSALAGTLCTSSVARWKQRCLHVESIDGLISFVPARHGSGQWHTEIDVW